MSVDQLSVSLTKEQAYALVDAVSERDDLALTASAHENEETGEWVFEATCDSPPDVDAFEAGAGRRGHLRRGRPSGRPSDRGRSRRAWTRHRS